ncbi:MAG: hypothetical protein NTY93_02555 [Candidatus Kaiserbacteria bacterium]|nr:hypothetical protein [Candidatus Kaiserbacteria bacterium]
MEPQQQEPTLEESIKQVMQTLPPPIRNYLGQGKYSIVAKNLMAKYGLRIDQGGILEREIMLLLMGIDTPEEFTQSLAGEANINQQIIGNIVQDVNIQIFIPLQEEMRNPVKSTEPAKSAAWKANVPQPPRPQQVNAPVPSYTYAPPTQTSQHFHLENKIPPRPSVAHSEGGPPRPTNNPPVSPSGLGAALKQVLHEEKQTLPSPKSVNIGRLLEDREEPHIEFPPNLPGAPTSDVIPPGVRFSPIAHEVQPSPVIPKVEPPAPPVSHRPYSVDPYREPVDTP